MLFNLPNRYFYAFCLMVNFFLLMNEYELVKEHETLLKAVLPVILSSILLLDGFKFQVMAVRMECLFVMIIYISCFQPDLLGQKTRVWFDRMSTDVGRYLISNLKAVIRDCAELASCCFELGWAMVVLISCFIWNGLWDFKFVVGLGVGGILREVLR